MKITKTWEPTESETAYTLMTKDTEILLDTTGLWKFSLTIKKENFADAKALEVHSDLTSAIAGEDGFYIIPRYH